MAPDASPKWSNVAINSDVTEQKQIEAQFFRAQRLESIGTLASGIAHDLNNVLAPIIMATDLLADGGPAEERTELVGMIREAAGRGSDMVRQVLSFARDIERQSIPVQLGPLLEGVRRIITETFPRSIKIDLLDATPEATVLGDPTQLHQVLLNLCVNARDAMPDGGSLTIQNRWRAPGAVPPEPGPGLVTLRVEDNGSGMEPAVLDRAIEPFFTTKAAGEGTGLGLSTSFAIVKSHSGTMSIDSEPGHGTVVEISLPLSERRAEDAGAPTSRLRHGGDRLVLLVDDEPTVLRVAQQILESHGFRVVTAADGAAAVATFSERDDIEVVFTDVMMPVMDGLDAARLMREIRPEVPIIVSTGLHTSDVLKQAAAIGIEGVVAKPYTASDLVGAIADAEPRTER